MSSLDGFYTTWDNARQTFGEGTPQTGEQYDDSAKLQSLGSSMEGAAPGSRWTGAAATKYDVANTEHRQVITQLADLDKRLATEVANSAQVVATGRQNLDSVRQWVAAAQASVPPGEAGEKIKMQIAQKGLTQLQEIIRSTNSESNAIGGRIGALDGEYQKLGDQKFAKEVGDDGPLRATGDEEEEIEKQAKEDVEKTLKDGDQAAAARVEQVLGTIKPYQELTPQQAAYLNEMQSQQHDMSVKDLKSAEDRLGDKGHIIGDSWQLMSNDDVPRSSGKYDEQQKGGFDRLPQQVQDAIKSPVPVPLPGDAQLKDITAIVKDGRQDLQTGTEIDRELMRRADRIMDTQVFTGEGVNPDKVAGLDGAVQDIFDSAGRDHQIVHDQITGTHGDDGQDFLHDITNHEWDDDGKAAGSLLSWTGEEAVGPNAEIAANTAEVYANYIGEHDNDLLDLNDRTLGDVNPLLVQGMAEGLMPYIPNIAGMSEGQLPYFDTPDTGDNIEKGLMPEAKGIFSVLSTDDKASTLFNGAAQHYAALANERFAEDFKNHVPGLSSQSEHLNDSATLQGLVDAGLHNALSHEKLNGIDLEKAVWDAKSQAWDQKAEILGTLGGKLPFVGEVIGTGNDLFGAAAKDAIVGQEPTAAATDKDGNYIAPDMAASTASAQLIGAMVNEGVAVQNVPPEWVVRNAEGEARVLSYAEVQALHPEDHTLSYSEYNRMLAQSLEGTVGQGFAADINQAMTDRYNQVSEVLDPQTAQPKNPGGG